MATQRRYSHRGPGRVDRRTFLGAAAAGSAAALGAPALLSAKSPNERLNVAVVGAGGRGAHDSAKVEAAGANIVAVCDVSEQRLAAAQKRHPKAKAYVDYRELYAEPERFDAVVVATPEHHHALATLPALRLGKHVYCEKPLTHNIREARKVREVAREAGVTTQQGTQKHATENYRRTVELIQANVIGPVREVHCWVSRAWGWHKSKKAAKEHNDRYTIVETPRGSTPKPEGLHWDLWVGPAQWRPFHEDYYPGPKWYRFWDFGNGTMSDLGSHRVDLPFWALKLTAPRTVEAFGPPRHSELAPASMHVVYEYPQRGDLPPVTLTWYQGTHKPPMWKEGTIPQWGNGCLFVGEEGMLLADYGRHVLLPEKKFNGLKGPERFLPRVPGHHAEWVHACEAGEPASCDFEYAGLLTEANHLGNVAFRTGTKLHWDTVTMQATNAAAAQRYIGRTYRRGWELT